MIPNSFGAEKKISTKLQFEETLTKNVLRVLLVLATVIAEDRRTVQFMA
jgi:hypothetical protein